MRTEYRVTYTEPRIAGERMTTTVAADNEDQARSLFAASHAGAAIAELVAWSSVPADDPSQAYKARA